MKNRSESRPCPAQSGALLKFSEEPAGPHCARGLGACKAKLWSLPLSALGMRGKRDEQKNTGAWAQGPEQTYPLDLAKVV